GSMHRIGAECRRQRGERDVDRNVDDTRPWLQYDAVMTESTATKTPDTCREPSHNRHCSECGRSFECQLVAGCNHCWCMDLPAVMPIVPQASCLCVECLKRAIDASTALNREV